MRQRWSVLLAFLVCGLCRTAAAQPEDILPEVEVGWGGRFRPDRWTPAFVTAQARQPTAVILRWYVPRPGRESMVIEQAAVLNPQRGTHIAYLPIGPDPAAVHLTVAEARTGRTLAHWPGSIVSPIEYADAQVRQPVFVGVSGAGPALLSLDRTRFNVAYLEPELLPRRAIGFNGLDLLALNRPQLATMELEQQEAIAAWVRGGGRLLIWLDLQALPDESPLLSLIPGGGVAEFGAHRVGDEEVPYTRLTEVPGDPLLTRMEIGQGEVFFLHVAPDVAQRQGVQFLPQESLPDPGEPPPLPAAALEAARDAAHGPDRRLLFPLLAIATLIGPVDWLVLRQTGRRIRRWLTLPGWLGVFAVLAWYLPSRPPPQTWVSIQTADAEAGAMVQRASVATTGQRLAGTDALELARLHETGLLFWRTTGFARTRGPLRDVVFVQGDEGMFAGGSGAAPAALVGEGLVIAERREPPIAP